MMYSPNFLFMSAESLSLIDSQDVERQQVEAPDGQQQNLTMPNKSKLRMSDNVISKKQTALCGGVRAPTTHPLAASHSMPKAELVFPSCPGRHLLPPDCAFSQNTPVN
jgi:hypothetical protein